MQTKIQVLKKGIDDSCKHKWIPRFSGEPLEEGTNDYDRICELCGRVEHVVDILEVVSFDDVYRKFYGKEKQTCLQYLYLDPKWAPRLKN